MSKTILLFSFSFLFFFQIQAKSSIYSHQYAKQKSYDVVALSDAFADYTIFVSDEEFSLLGVEKGNWNPIDFLTFKRILANHDASIKPGGSGVNLLKGLAKFGWKCAVMGKIGSDETGKQYQSKVKELHIHSFFKKIDKPTGRVLCVITPDCNRTFFTFEGAALDASSHKTDAFYQKARLFHIEGYQLPREEMLENVLEQMRKKASWVSLDLANKNITRQKKAFVQKILRESVDIVFANQEEAQELTGLSPFLACQYLSNFCKIAVVTMSSKGGWVSNGKQLLYFPAKKTQVVDTTGAGDLFASGFLHGFLQNYSLHDCAKIGALVASAVIEQIGAEISESFWQDIYSEIDQMNASSELFNL